MFSSNNFIKNSTEKNKSTNTLLPIYYPINIEKVLFGVKNVFDINECNKLIRLSENQGYVKASLYTDESGVEHYETDVRNSERCIIDDINFAAMLENKIKHLIPTNYMGLDYHSINYRFRFQRYYPGEYFRRHSDGRFQTNTLVSLITILIYLNDDYEGGYTRFFESPDDQIGFDLVPTKGMVCFMDQSIGHEVPPLKKGVKYVIRTELMYNRHAKKRIIV